MTAIETTVYGIASEGIKNGSRSNWHRHIQVSSLKSLCAAATDFSEQSDTDWEDIRNCVVESVTRNDRKAIEAAVRVIDDAVNGQNEDLVVAAFANVHCFLLDKIASAVMKAIKQYHMNDGRIGNHFKVFIREYY